MMVATEIGSITDVPAPLCTAADVNRDSCDKGC
jgi:hypothetical protein